MDSHVDGYLEGYINKESRVWDVPSIRSYLLRLNPDKQYPDDQLRQLAEKWNSSVTGKALSAPSRYLDTPGKRLGANIGVGGTIGAGLGAVAGGTRGALMGGSIGAILGYIAKNYFDWDINRASTWMQERLRKGKAPQQIADIAKHETGGLNRKSISSLPFNTTDAMKGSAKKSPGPEII